MINNNITSSPTSPRRSIVKFVFKQAKLYLFKYYNVNTCEREIFNKTKLPPSLPANL